MLCFPQCITDTSQVYFSSVNVNPFSCQEWTRLTWVNEWNYAHSAHALCTQMTQNGIIAQLFWIQTQNTTMVTYMILKKCNKLSLNNRRCNKAQMHITDNKNDKKKRTFKCGVSRREFWEQQFTVFDCKLYIYLLFLLLKTVTCTLYNKSQLA